MKLLDNVYLVGSGEVGLSEPDDCHIYLIDCGDEYALVDSGSGADGTADRIEVNVRCQGLDPERITTLLLTHWHFDHAGGARQIRDRFGCHVLAPEIEREFIEHGRDGLPECPVVRGVNNGEVIRVGNREIVARVVPGHSEGTTAYQIDLGSHRALFAGDIVFVNGIIGLINYPGSDLTNYRTYITRLAELDIGALLPGHMLFTVRDGQRHIDRAIVALDGQFVPYSIGQLGISYVPASRFG